MLHEGYCGVLKTGEEYVTDHQITLFIMYICQQKRIFRIYLANQISNNECNDFCVLSKAFLANCKLQ